MTRIKPYSGKSRDRLTALINQFNDPDRVESVDFEYEDPVVERGPLTIHNTTVRLVPVQGTRYEGPVKVHYARLDLGVLAQLPEGELQSVQIDTVPFWMHQHLDNINECLGLDLEPDEVFNDRVDELNDHYTLRVNGEKSLAWITSSYRFASHQSSPLIQIDFNREADGFFANTPAVNPLKVASRLGGFTSSVNPAVRTLRLNSEVDNFWPLELGQVNHAVQVDVRLSGRGFEITQPIPKDIQLGLVDALNPAQSTEIDYTHEIAVQYSGHGFENPELLPASIELGFADALLPMTSAEPDYTREIRESGILYGFTNASPAAPEIRLGEIDAVLPRVLQETDYASEIRVDFYGVGFGQPSFGDEISLAEADALLPSTYERQGNDILHPQHTANVLAGFSTGDQMVPEI